ncbi:MAG TPA: hypothetical protein PLR12_06110, partial [Clostridia bacterium]|nr:hypothetical protein [Clostridia bacterium]
RGAGGRVRPPAPFSNAKRMSKRADGLRIYDGSANPENKAQPKPAPNERGNAETQKANPSKRLR